MLYAGVESRHPLFLWAFKKKTEKTRQKAIDIVGNKCWVCGYDRTFSNLCFHHVDDSDKSFGLSIREMTGYAWERVISEIKKCVLVCHNCHGEIHDGLISKVRITKLWESKWKNARLPVDDSESVATKISTKNS